MKFKLFGRLIESDYGFSDDHIDFLPAMVLIRRFEMHTLSFSWCNVWFEIQFFSKSLTKLIEEEHQ